MAEPQNVPGALSVFTEGDLPQAVNKCSSIALPTCVQSYEPGSVITSLTTINCYRNKITDNGLLIVMSLT